MKTTTTAKQILARRYVVLVAGDAPKPAVLDACDDLGLAERQRQTWLECYGRRPDSPMAATYVRIGNDEGQILEVLRQLPTLVSDRKASVHIESAIQEVLDWRNGARR